MINIEKLQIAQEKIIVEPSNNIFHELGNNTYDLRDLISELIDNSIAARRPDIRLKITIEFWIDNNNNCNAIVVRDNALGIPQNRLGVAISPAAVQSSNSLNEHGLGMKQSIAGLGKLKYLATKTPTEPKARIIRELKYGQLPCYLADFNDISGTEICITEIKPIVNTNPSSITKTLVPYLGARYRRFLKPENRIAEVSIFTINKKTGDLQYSWDVVEVKPIYFHPSTRNNKPVLENKKISGTGWRAELTFGYAPTDNELKELGIVDRQR